MAYYHKFATRINEHDGGNFPCVGALFFPVHILGGYMNGGIL